MKIFAYCLREFDEKPMFDRLAGEFDAQYGYSTSYPGPDNVSLARGYDAVSCTPCDMGADMLQRFYDVGVRYVATRSIGYDHIDLETARRLGMGVCRASYEPETVADYAIMLMLMCCRNMPHIMNRSLVQDYSLKGKMGRDISDSTVGIIGAGQIGCTVIRHLRGFGCRLLAYDLHRNPQIAGLAEYVPLEQLYAESDIITLHTPATAENYHLIDAKALSRMKNGVILINTARGSLVDTEALIQALESGKIGHAALDVLEDEAGLYYANRMGDVIVNRQMAILRAFPNVILSPHTAFYTEKVVWNMAYKTFNGVQDMMRRAENPLVILPGGQGTQSKI